MIEDDDIEIITPYVIQMQEKIKRLEIEKSVNSLFMLIRNCVLNYPMFKMKKIIRHSI